MTSGGLILGFNWLGSCRSPIEKTTLQMPEEWFDMNAYLKIGDNGVVTIFSPNPEFGQNVMTSMPMIVAEELDVKWDNVIVEQAPFDEKLYNWQFTGGSRGIMSRWKGLREAGAIAKHMIKQAAAQKWEVPIEEVSTEDGIVHHTKSGKSYSYGDLASMAAQVPIPEKVELKNPSDFKVIGSSKRNVRNKAIVTGKPMFGVDYLQEGMLYAMLVFPPGFGQKLDSFDATEALKMPGIKDIFEISTYKEDYNRGGFDTNAFTQLIAVVGDSTWEVMNARKKVLANWVPIEDSTRSTIMRGREVKIHTPGGLESSADHVAEMKKAHAQPGKVTREDGNPEKAFAEAAQVIERTYYAPYLAHNCMEPMNFFAHVTKNSAVVAGPLQAPNVLVPAISHRLDIPKENIDVKMTRMGGGFGRRAYAHYGIEAALISQKMEAPIKLLYSREDDMKNGIYRPVYMATYKAGIDAEGSITAMHIKAGGIPESPLFANRFPAGAIENYKAEEWKLDSNITIGAFRAPRSNFIAGAEQSFLDEIAELTNKDPIQLRLSLLEKAEKNPIGEKNDYDPSRYAGVLKLVREKSNWQLKANADDGKFRGISAYFCHNSYAAHVLEMTMKDGNPIIENVCCAIDCGIVINPDAATNMAEGAITDGIGNALFGEMTFEDGIPQKDNFDKYRMIKMKEAPKNIDVHFVKNEVDPTGLGEPPFPPIFGALSNAIYKATGKRQYDQPFLAKKKIIG